eukprot:TRINITY_DN166107_c0_g1_i1.p1 TRINITY_DN166107_c0_g1~~TRINITY_DN166107_c0_g1_i1.p1  ORF type:complete len:962 (-),score=294.01 TRINITY_DN166107_c0_g1_i1:67-2952(-)
MDFSSSCGVLPRSQDLKNIIFDLEDENQFLNQQVQQKVNEIQHLEAKVQQKEQEYKFEAEKVRSLELECTKLRNDGSENERENNRLKADLEVNEKEKSEFKKQCNSFKEEIESTEDQLAKAIRECQKSKKAEQRQQEAISLDKTTINNLEEVNNHLREKLQGITSDFQSMNSELQLFSEKMQQSKREVKSKDDIITRLESTIRTLKAERLSLQELCDKKDSVLRDSQLNFSNTEDDLQREIASIRLEYANIEDKLKRENSDLKTSEAVWERKYHRLEKEHIALGDRLRTTVGELTRAQSDNQHADTILKRKEFEFEELGKRKDQEWKEQNETIISDSASQLAIETERALRAEARLSTTQKELQETEKDFKLRLNSLQRDLNQVNEALTSSQSEHNTSKRMIIALEMDLEKKTKQLKQYSAIVEWQRTSSQAKLKDLKKKSATLLKSTATILTQKAQASRMLSIWKHRTEWSKINAERTKNLTMPLIFKCWKQMCRVKRVKTTATRQVTRLTGKIQQLSEELSTQRCTNQWLTKRMQGASKEARELRAKEASRPPPKIMTDGFINVDVQELKQFACLPPDTLDSTTQTNLSTTQLSSALEHSASHVDHQRHLGGLISALGNCLTILNSDRDYQGKFIPKTRKRKNDRIRVNPVPSFSDLVDQSIVDVSSKSLTLDQLKSTSGFSKTPKTAEMAGLLKHLSSTEKGGMSQRMLLPVVGACIGVMDEISQLLVCRIVELGLFCFACIRRHRSFGQQQQQQQQQHQHSNITTPNATEVIREFVFEKVMPEIRWLAVIRRHIGEAWTQAIGPGSIPQTSIETILTAKLAERENETWQMLRDSPLDIPDTTDESTAWSMLSNGFSSLSMSTEEALFERLYSVVSLVNDAPQMFSKNETCQLMILRVCQCLLAMADRQASMLDESHVQSMIIHSFPKAVRSAIPKQKPQSNGNNKKARIGGCTGKKFT